MTPLEKLRKARAALVLQSPFFGSLALRLNFATSTSIETAEVNATTVTVNPDWLATLSMPQTTGLLAHEVMHLATGQLWRRGTRDPAKFNLAGDLAINPLLVDNGFTLPADGVMPEAYGLARGESADFYFARLPDKNGGGGKDGDESGDGEGRDPGGCGGMADDPGEEPGDGKDGQQAGNGGASAGESPGETEWQIATLQAANLAQAAGNMPGGLERLVETLRHPRADWRTVLGNFIKSAIPHDYAMFPPNRRFIAQGLYLPSLKPDTLGPIVVAVDTSGSIGQELLDQFASELNAIIGETEPDRVTVIYCDATVNRVDEYEKGERVTLTAIGGGGTDFAPVFAAVERLAIDPVGLVYLTDLYGPCNRPEPSYPVLWATIGDTSAPWGEVVELN